MAALACERGHRDVIRGVRVEVADAEIKTKEVEWTSIGSCDSEVAESVDQKVGSIVCLATCPGGRITHALEEGRIEREASAVNLRVDAMSRGRSSQTLESNNRSQGASRRREQSQCSEQGPIHSAHKTPPFNESEKTPAPTQ